LIGGIVPIEKIHDHKVVLLIIAMAAADGCSMRW